MMGGCPPRKARACVVTTPGLVSIGLRQGLDGREMAMASEGSGGLKGSVA